MVAAESLVAGAVVNFTGPCADRSPLDARLDLGLVLTVLVGKEELFVAGASWRVGADGDVEANGGDVEEVDAGSCCAVG